MKISKTIKYKNGNYRTGTLVIVELSPSCVNAYIAYLIGLFAGIVVVMVARTVQ